MQYYDLYPFQSEPIIFIIQLLHAIMYIFIIYNHMIPMKDIYLDTWFYCYTSLFDMVADITI